MHSLAQCHYQTERPTREGSLPDFGRSCHGYLLRQQPSHLGLSLSCTELPSSQQFGNLYPSRSIPTRGFAVPIIFPSPKAPNEPQTAHKPFDNKPIPISHDNSLMPSTVGDVFRGNAGVDGLSSEGSVVKKPSLRKAPRSLSMWYYVHDFRAT